MNIGDKPAADLEGVRKAALEVQQRVLALVDPDGPGEVAEDRFGAVSRVGVWIAAVVHCDGTSAVKGRAPLVAELPQLQHASRGNDLVAARVGRLAGSEPLPALVERLSHFFVDALVLLVKIGRAERFTVLAHQLFDGHALQPEAVVLAYFGLFGTT